MKRMVGILCALVVSLGITSCDFINGLFGITAYPGTAGNLLSVDKDKHFTQKVSYHEYSAVATFNTDGTYEEDYYSSTTPDVQTGGSKGTYAYDPKALQMVENVTSYYSQNDQTWKDYSSTVNAVSTDEWFYAEHSRGTVYKSSGSSWVNTGTWQWTDSANSANSYTETGTETYTLSNGKGGFVYAFRGVHQNADGSTIKYNTTDQAGDTEFLPAGVTLTKGNTVTIRIAMTSYTKQTYDWSAGKLNDVTNGQLGLYLNVFSCMGDYIIWYPSASSRELAPASLRHE